MSEIKRYRWSWVMVLVAALSAVLLLAAELPGSAVADGHEEVRNLRAAGDVVPLVQLLASPAFEGARVIEAELEHEHGRLVYELEILDASGRIREVYVDARSGEPLGEGFDD